MSHRLCILAFFAFALSATTQLPAIPEPPLMLLGTVTDASTNQPVTITNIVWQVTDGTANKTFSTASLRAASLSPVGT